MNGKRCTPLERICACGSDAPRVLANGEVFHMDRKHQSEVEKAFAAVGCRLVFNEKRNMFVVEVMDS